MLYAVRNPYCLDCGAVDEKTLLLSYEGKLVHQCTNCGSNSIMWQVGQIIEDDEEPKVNQGERGDLADESNDFICHKCRAEGKGRN